MDKIQYVTMLVLHTLYDWRIIDVRLVTLTRGEKGQNRQLHKTPQISSASPNSSASTVYKAKVSKPYSLFWLDPPAPKYQKMPLMEQFFDSCFNILSYLWRVNIEGGWILYRGSISMGCSVFCITFLYIHKWCILCCEDCLNILESKITEVHMLVSKLQILVKMWNFWWIIAATEFQRSGLEKGWGLRRVVGLGGRILGSKDRLQWESARQPQPSSL